MAKTECIFTKYANNCNLAYIFYKLSNGKYRITRKWKVYGKYIPYGRYVIKQSDVHNFFITHSLN